jgi:alkanesulfonate monooxygenase SsuD/methylene tetrahydromethanopterin reductase-like flavin-dependent oxidoreductase (luciferase family)
VRFLLEPVDARDLDGLAALGEAARSFGLDGVLVSASSALPGSLAAAGALAGRVADILIAAEVFVGARHPLEIAEEAAVTDLASGGRLILVARPAPGGEERYEESLDVMRHAFGARPFRFEGEHWQVPANLPQNAHQEEQAVRLAPAPAQPRLEVWGAGGGRDTTLPRALGFLADADEPDDVLARAYAGEDSPAAIGAPRGRRERWTGASELLARLRAARAAWGQDWAVVRAPAAAADEIGSIVRPRVQLERLPFGLEQHWDERRPWEHRQR